MVLSSVYGLFCIRFFRLEQWDGGVSLLPAVIDGPGLFTSV